MVAARGSVMAFKAIAVQTGGDFSLMERTVRARSASAAAPARELLGGLLGAGRHDHVGARRRGAAGRTGRLPARAAREAPAHTFGNDGDEPARLLVLHAPAMDGYLAELDALWSRERGPGPGGRARPDGPLWHEAT